ncbi:hypothetical protein A0H76_2892 [Hepatospora eriocheir]|uniref:Uncharacterized protein n=1 Tax=Hepatospora eriocheir TaxID=1081669 RepID=A0A1X0Q5L3_9MICR|nr:hypothetical protein A0H76_2892 [Hepatospora eriocheir]
MIIYKLPKIEELDQLLNKFMLYSNFPNTILVVDGTLIPITNPTNSRERFINRKRHASINFLIVLMQILK